MIKFFASLQKELLLLWRDKHGLFLLFIMPAFLVSLITIIQENVLKTDIKVLFRDNDKNEIGQKIENLLENSQNIILSKNLKGEIITEETANRAVADGLYQFCIIIPENLTDLVKEKCKNDVQNQFFEKEQKQNILIPEIKMYFDPTIQGSFKVAVGNILKRVAMGIELEFKLKYMGVNVSFENPNQALIQTKEVFATNMGFVKQPTSVQQNVPAWTLFGIFFIVVPIAGSLISERQSGTLLRLKSMPVSYFTIILGKISAYMLICFGQFAIIFFIGKFILPCFGLTAFDAGHHHGVFFLILLSSICAATGYGILLGTVMKTYEQASMFGPVSVVIAAAIGGILVPVYTMPAFIQTVSILSPLAWGQNAFYDILLRGGGLKSALPEICSLFAFFLITLMIAIFYKNQSFK